MSVMFAKVHIIRLDMRVGFHRTTTATTTTSTSKGTASIDTACNKTQTTFRGKFVHRHPLGHLFMANFSSKILKVSKSEKGSCKDCSRGSERTREREKERWVISQALKELNEAAATAPARCEVSSDCNCCPCTRQSSLARARLGLLSAPASKNNNNNNCFHGQWAACTR